MILAGGTLVGLGCGDASDAAAEAPPGGGGPPSAQVRLGSVAMEPVRQVRRVTGNLRAKQRSQVATIEAGRVIEVKFDEAQDVSAGDVLVKLDDRRIVEERAEVQADLAVAESMVAQMEAELERVRGDLESRELAAERAEGAVSQLDMRQARTAVTVAESQVEAAGKQVAAVRTRLARLQVRENDLTVRAPFDGRILMRMSEVGEYLQPGDPVAVLASVGTYEAVLDAPESIASAGLLDAPMDAFVITIDSTGQVLVAQQVRVVGDVDPRSRRYQVVVDVKTTDGQALTPGASVTAQMPIGGEEPRLIVPANAIRHRTNGTFIYLALGEPGQPPAAIPTFIEVAYQLGDRAVLSTSPNGPLQPGMPLVVEGGERVLFPGQPLADADADAGSEQEEGAQ